MNIETKKKIAKEILILFALVCTVAVVALGIWFYGLYINNNIEIKNNEIKSEKETQLFLDVPYEKKFQKIKSFILLLKEKQTWGSNYDLYLISKEKNFTKALKIYSDEQFINGKLPNSNDSASYITCIKSLNGKYFPEDLSASNTKSAELISVWECIASNKENLFYFLPLPILEEYKIENKADLNNVIKILSFSSDEINKKNKYIELETKIQELEKKRNDLMYKMISTDGLIHRIKFFSIILLIIAYPFRLLIITVKWAFKNYRQT